MSARSAKGEHERGSEPPPVGGGAPLEEQPGLSGRIASKALLAAAAVGDLGGPLAYVLANLEFLDAQLAEHEADLPAGRAEELRRCLREATFGARRMRDIVREVDERSHPRPEEATVDLHRLLLTCIKVARTEIDHRARVATEFGAVAPLAASESRLSRLFLNLIVNAAQAVAGDAQNEHFIRVVTRNEAPHRVTVEVTDSGPGIPPDLLDRIFEPFFTTKPAGQGTGLGLAICRQIAHELGGSISAESEAGRGATFRVMLPIGQHRAAAGSVAPPSAVRFSTSEPPVRRLPLRQLG